MLRMVVKKGKAALFQHLLELEQFLHKNNTTFIGGEEFSLGDIGWGAILARMEYADWWVHVDPQVSDFFICGPISMLSPKNVIFSR